MLKWPNSLHEYPLWLFYDDKWFLIGLHFWGNNILISGINNIQSNITLKLSPMAHLFYTHKNITKGLGVEQLKDFVLLSSLIFAWSNVLFSIIFDTFCVSIYYTIFGSLFSLSYFPYLKSCFSEKTLRKIPVLCYTANACKSLK